MDYLKLVLGLVLTSAFFWLLLRNSDRKGFFNSLLRVDTIIGLCAGLYLVFSSSLSLLTH